MTAEVVPLYKGMEVQEIAVKEIKSKFRLRTPNDEKIQEIASSIKLCGLINPVTVDANLYLLAGYHRWKAFELLGYSHIPAVIHDEDKLRGELVEVEENLSRNELNAIEEAEHLGRREEILTELGLLMPFGGNQYSKGKVTIKERAEGIGMAERTYKLKKQILNIEEEVRDILKETPYASHQMDMVKLSQQSPEVQREVCKLLITGKVSTFKRALQQSLLEGWRDAKPASDIGFSLKQRYGVAKSIMRFQKADNHLQELVQMINKSEGVEVTKRTTNWGTNTIPNYTMIAEHSQFLVDYYTKEGDLILDNFMGRGTNVLASLYHNRKVVGVDVNEENVQKLREVCVKHFPEQHGNYQLHNSCGVTLKEWEGQSEVFDAVVTDPPYVCGAETYGMDPRDIAKQSHQEYMESISQCFENLTRLIKTSNFEEKRFHPIIFKVGSGRKGVEGIVDMDFEFQLVARNHGLVLWDKVFNELHSIWGNLCAVRNYKNGYVQKNFETNLVFCKFD